MNSQELTFLNILLCGLVYIVVISLFSLGHDHEPGHGGGHGSHGSHGSHGAATPGQSMPSLNVLSPKVISIFMAGFGAAGFISSELHHSIFASTAWGFVGGLVIGTCAYAGLMLLYGQQATSEVSSSDAIGKVGAVTVTIPVDGTGEVSVSINGLYQTYPARLSTSRMAGKNYSPGTPVKIDSAFGSTLLVS